MGYKSDIEIAQECEMLPITQIAEKAGIDDKYLEQYGTSDAQAYMSQFYPHIKRSIIESWSRLFDDSIILGSSKCYGNIWEVKKEWISEIIR